MNSGIISRTNVILKINNDEKILCQLKRHLSPMTVGLIIRKLPLGGNAHRLGQHVVYFQTKINSGIERKRSDFKKGDIAFLPTEGSICFFIDDVYDSKPMSVIGKITDGIDKLNAVKPSDVLSLSGN